MQIVDLSEQHREAWLHCLEPWAPEAREGHDRRAAWYERVKDKGLLVKLALDEDGSVAGMAQAVPAELGTITGDGLYQLLCIWVHGHRRGIGNRQGRGLGTALLHAIEEAVRARGARGLAAWGVMGPFWMRARWFEKHGYRKVDRDGLAVLVFKPLSPDATRPRWLPHGPPPAPAPDAVEVVCFNSGWCAAQNATCEHARRAAARFGPDARFRLVDTLGRDAAVAGGYGDALFIDGRPVRTGPPPSERRLRAQIAWRHLRRRFGARRPR